MKYREGPQVDNIIHHLYIDAIASFLDMFPDEITIKSKIYQDFFMVECFHVVTKRPISVLKGNVKGGKLQLVKCNGLIN